MGNPLNPLNWLKSAQDWFTKTEKSSGFRPYLIFLIIDIGAAISILTFFHTYQYAEKVGFGLIILPVLFFIVIYTIKAFSDPDFCRSESHVQKIMQIELEYMGNESRQFAGNIIEAQMIESAEIEQRQMLPPQITSEGDKGAQ